MTLGYATRTLATTSRIPCFTVDYDYLGNPTIEHVQSPFIIHQHKTTLKDI